MNVGVVGNPRFKDIKTLLSQLNEYGAANGLSVLVGPDLHQVMPDPLPELTPTTDLALLLTFGGDGTLLRGARLMKSSNAPILGINLGRVGFLTSAGPDQMMAALDSFLSGEYRIENRCALDSSIEGEDGSARAGSMVLNDIVVHKEGVARVIRIRVWVDDEEVGVYSADGVIVSTPTGSTAYALSAGGPIVMPEVDALTITAICPHTLAVRPLVVPGSAVITLQQAQPRRDEVLVSYDGQVEATLQSHERVVVRQSPDAVKLVRLGSKGYFEGVRQKLQWGDLSDRG
ncbi:MAG: NAD(+)/NADH kinase [Gemmatimonadota bacterium]|nr:MAG: NAD(+)/NADH kinase [Gemmatimonadota bacterium]